MLHVAFLIGFIVMALGSLALYADGARHGDAPTHSLIHAAVPFIAATAYLAMYLGTGTTQTGDTTIYLQRYADWAVTTPLLLVALVLLPLKDASGRSGFIIALVALDVLMIGTGLFSSIGPAPTRLAWFLWSCAAFAGVLWLLWVPVRGHAALAGKGIANVYRGDLIYLTVVWIAYPLVFATGPEGARLIDTAGSVWMFLILDVIAKPVYGYVSAKRLRLLMPEVPQGLPHTSRA